MCLSMIALWHCERLVNSCEQMSERVGWKNKQWMEQIVCIEHQSNIGLLFDKFINKYYCLSYFSSSLFLSDFYNLINQLIRIGLKDYQNFIHKSNQTRLIIQ